MNVVAGMCQEISLVHSAGDLQVPLLATLAESLLYFRGGTEKDTHIMFPKVFVPYSGVTQLASPPLP